MIHFHHTFLLIFVILPTSLSPIFGQIIEQKNFNQISPAQLSIIIENDAAFDTDRDYTGGIFTTYRPRNSSLSYTLGLEVYTPNSNSAIVDVTDHPYAGWLYLKTQYAQLHGEKALSKIALSLGTTGRNTFAHQIQNYIHELLGVGTFEGWDTQIPGKFGYSLDLSLKYLVHSLSKNTNGFDVQTSIEGFTTIGNIKKLVGIGPEVKMGYNIDRFNDKVDPNQNFRLYAYANIYTTYVSSNYLLQGNNGRTVPGGTYDIELERNVCKWSKGIVIGYKSFDLTVYTTSISHEYTTQEIKDRYGGISASWKF